MFAGRQLELQKLKSLLKKKTASLAVIRGRRRIGKSRLIEEFGKDKDFYSFSGIVPTKETTSQMQMAHFTKQLLDYFNLPGFKPDDWYDIFAVLAKETQDKKAVILLDEISWMGSKDPTFLSKLKDAWDRQFKKNPNLILILCGSVSSWIDQNILFSSGFVGRISMMLTLDELPLSACNQFWKGASGRVSVYEKLKILSVTGGIPRYLEEINTNISAEENIRNLCFSREGFLVYEFDQIFNDLFAHRSGIYKKIIQSLSQGPKTAEDISQDIGLEYTGYIIDYLDDLQTSGFISRDYTWIIRKHKPSKLSHFRLSDNYLRFYVKYIDPIKERILRHSAGFESLAHLEGMTSFMGYQFENLVLNNRLLIMESLGLSPSEIVCDNPFFQRATQRQKGVQIDYLIQSKFSTLYVCEIKFSKGPVGMSIIQEIQEKIDRLKAPSNFSIRPVLIHVNGVTEDVEDSGYFSDIICFGDFLET